MAYGLDRVSAGIKSDLDIVFDMFRLFECSLAAFLGRRFVFGPLLVHFGL